MLPTSRYTSFFSTHHFYEGVRVTVGIMVPVLVAARYDEIGWGLAMALGALCVSLTDNPGPLHHRINGMLAAVVFIFITSLVTGYALPYTGLVMVLLAGFSFFFSLIGVFGTRASYLGTSVLVAITLQLTESPLGIWGNALLTAAGGVWYFLLSIALYRIRPYKLAQQVLGDCIMETGKFLALKANFYGTHPDLDDLYTQLLKAQVEVHNKQQVVREILFKTRSIVKESTHTGRVLVMAFLDTVDLFETTLTSEQDYREMQNKLGTTELLPHVGNLLQQIADQLMAIGVAMQEGKSFPAPNNIDEWLAGLKETYADSRQKFLNEENAEAFNGLSHVIGGISELLVKVKNLTMYTTYDKRIKLEKKIDYQRFVVPSYINIRLLLDNIRFSSNIFRYSVRMAAAVLAGYGLSLYFPVGHSYWILLTIVVILKPAYALTKQRNMERLLGTVAGGVVGALILMNLKSVPLLLGILIVSMIAAFSLIRIRYWLGVALLTLYVLVAFYLLQPGDYAPLFKDRLLDTFIGSVIAFVFTRIIPPIWERDQIRHLLLTAIVSNKNYYTYIASAFVGKPIDASQYKFYRKETYVSLANLSDAFQRMLNEPKSRQHTGEFMHPLVVSCHVLASRIATLSGYSRTYAPAMADKDFNIFIEKGAQNLDAALQWLQPDAGIVRQPEARDPLNWLEPHIIHLKAELGKKENRQGNGVWENAQDAVLLQFEAVLTLTTDIRILCRQLVENEK